ncbi:RPAP1-like protein [Lipomyces orientalis]|uniref:RPAP1-like protein n=1 Tax=Lipomyces orientalis TaxID=1233043 RepID=A0ACC3TGW8_9ASCO
MDVVRDIIERSVLKGSDVNASRPEVPQPPQSRKSKSLWRSRINANKGGTTPQSGISPRSGGHTTRAGMTMATTTSEAAKISEENEERIASMTPEEIEAEKAALEASLPPGLISRILKRDPCAADAILWDSAAGANNNVITQSSTFDTKEIGNDPHATEGGQTGQDDIATTNTDGNLATTPIYPESREYSTHFPSPISTELDPDAPNFLELLHKKYFPDLPVEPSRLAWMKPVTDEEDNSSPYNPQQESVSPADIRFDFHGDIIPPSKSASLSTALGLHHHSDSPGYAGYTIPELSHLCRSAVAAQRAIAVQVIGRILYKLGINHYGEYVGDALWDIVEHTRVVESLYEAADEKKTRHVGLQTCAVEALWLWKKGGGRRHKTD